MSKKKATMTLKDFHGGSIPSDLPLPSAPGTVVRPLDRGGLDRAVPWGNPVGRSDHRLRPGSAGAVRSLDDKTPFLTHSVHIGRNFDEDERKPLDGMSAPRRTVSDESIHPIPVRLEPKLDYSSTVGGISRPFSNPEAHLSSGGAKSSYAAAHVGMQSQNFSGSRPAWGVNNQNASGSSEQAVGGSHLNAWGMRKEVVVGVGDRGPMTWSAPDAVSKLAHASALEKVSSGRWHSKQPMHHPVDVEVIGNLETEIEVQSSMYDLHASNVMNVPGGREFHDVTLARHAERSLAIDEAVPVGGKELPSYERPRSPLYSETKDRNPPFYADGVQLARLAGKSGGPELPMPVPSESSDRPKLKLLPRSKPYESSEPYVDYKQGYQLQVDRAVAKDGSEFYGNANPTKPGLGGPETYEIANPKKTGLAGPELYGNANVTKPGFAEPERYGNANPTKPGLTGSEIHGNTYPIKAGSAGPDTGNQAVERPKLSLKPRSQPVEQLPRNVERERNILFGGARPREFVLKERGFDDVPVNNHDLGQPIHRVKQDFPRAETLPVHATPRYNEKGDYNPLDHRNGKTSERHDQRMVIEKSDNRRNWRSENRRSGRDLEKHQPHERAPSPETWRKPIEQPAPVDAPGQRYRKAASAVELAQAFSRSVSDPKTDDRVSGPRALSSHGQIPFSRLMGAHPRPQINGY
ncbi:hypothetical protein RJ640_005462 [Escallonia rubra]|uniref:Eukaryotic translation initiation factor-related n=1 Tax=Escallonia rubra TaxID=112253 RepID=A0AA88RWW4_9ASTE|nr:hypothetical protein RJ640_005462 [Escallonia rubra]